MHGDFVGVSKQVESFTRNRQKRSSDRSVFAISLGMPDGRSSIDRDSLCASNDTAVCRKMHILERTRRLNGACCTLWQQQQQQQQQHSLQLDTQSKRT